MNINVTGLNFGYSKHDTVLNNIDLSIEKSTSVSILGSSGCGKSTLLRLFSGLLPETNRQSFEGEIIIDDISIQKEKEKWRKVRERGELGFMFQDATLLPNLTVEKNIEFPLNIIQLKSKNRSMVSDYLKLTGLTKHKLKYPNELSGGMKTRVALARTFITKPKLLLLDEPFTSLDIVWKARLYEEVKRLKNIFSTTVILVTHDIFEAIYFAKKIVILGKSGQILKTIEMQNWADPISYSEVVEQYGKEFTEIKKIIEENGKI